MTAENHLKLLRLNAVSTSEQQSILVVDEETLIREALADCLQSEGYCCATAGSEDEALAELADGCFDLVITDLASTTCDGVEWLNILHDRFPQVTIITLGNQQDFQTAVEIMRGGASDYITKPFALDEVVASVDRIAKRRRQRINLAGPVKGLLKRRSLALDLALQSLEKQRDLALELLLAAMEARHQQIGRDARRVQNMALRLARNFDLSDAEMLELARGALLCDLGKIGISELILRKHGDLSRAEWDQIKQHPVIGFDILSRFDFLKASARLVLYHHERYDGSGYPRGLQGRKIPLPARIFAVVDAYEAMTEERPFRSALSPVEARREIQSAAGTQFDPVVVREFLTIDPQEWEQLRRQAS